ncbi:MAG TPA: NAD(P)H-dependent oxidoreductase, partial [Desulfosarcina sp.]|nr:NAD(P)H-dependent oxidoreductase [Desulfosarcina sp.]
ARKRGARTRELNACTMNIQPCKEFTTCEKKGFCPIKDDMDPFVYPLLREADVVVPASPVFFYNVTAQLKALIDRSQTLWARNYRLGLTDPNRKMRRGFILSQGATRGKNLFLGVDLTAKYFFDAVGASHEGSLYYWRIEHRGDMETHPTVREDVAAAVDRLLAPFMGRRKVLFVCRDNACLSQMAGALARIDGGDKLDVSVAGVTAADAIDPTMEKAMAEKGIDMGFRIPRTVTSVLAEETPERIITLGPEPFHVESSETRIEHWTVSPPEGADTPAMLGIFNDLEQRIRKLITE